MIIPCFRTSIIVEKLICEINDQLTNLNSNVEIILVCDEDRPETVSLLHEIRSRVKNVEIVELSKNFGQASSIYAGILNSTGDFIFTMDDDFQHDPKYLNSMIHAMDNLTDLVYAVDVSRQDTKFRNLSSLIYKDFILKKLGLKNSSYFSAFRLIRRSAIATTIEKSQTEFIDLVAHWSTNRVKTVEVINRKRLEGKSGYNISSLTKLGFRIVLTYSDYLLRVIVRIGVAVFGLSVLFSIWILHRYIIGEISPTGFTTIVILISFYSSLQIIFLGIIARYIGTLFEKSLGKPKFIVRNSTLKK